MTSEETHVALETLTKWRSLFAGWQLGTRRKGDPESDAVKDHRELTILLRCELSALTGTLIKKGVFTAEEYNEALGQEAILLEMDYQERFPGVMASSDGLSFDTETIVKSGWMKNWKP